MNLMNFSRHQKQHLQKESMYLKKPGEAARYFRSMYSNTMRMKLKMAMMRLPKAAVPR